MWARFRDDSNTRVTSPLKTWTPQRQDSSTSGANSCLLKSFWAFSYLTLQRCHLKNERKTDPAKGLEKQKEKFCASECLHRLLPKLLDSMFTLTDMFLHISASVYLPWIQWKQEPSLRVFSFQRLQQPDLSWFSQQPCEILETAIGRAPMRKVSPRIECNASIIDIIEKLKASNKSK